MKTKMDHLVIGADDLRQGIAYVKACLGIDMPYGGAHDKMGTHNHLMQLGDHVFLEVIAVDPAAEPPARPRWFGLDDPHVRRRIRSEPALLGWVVSTHDIDDFLQQAGFCFGKSTLIHRGNLSWHFGLPEDGRLLAGGMLPYVIEWRTPLHPSMRMADLRCRLQNLEIYHSHPLWLQSILDSIGAADLVKINALPANRPPYLVAHIHTPQGVRALRSDAGN